MIRRCTAAALALTVLGLPAAAEIQVTDAFARASSPQAKSGAAFMTLVNGGDQEDRLIAAASSVAARVEIHTHSMENGVMRMRHLEDGIVLAPGAAHALERGGDHVMFMGLTRPLSDGDTVTVTLTFERAGEIEIEVPVDLSR